MNFLEKVNAQLGEQVNEEIILLSVIDYNNVFIIYITAATCFGLFYRSSSGNTLRKNTSMYTAVYYYLRAWKFTGTILPSLNVVAFKISRQKGKNDAVEVQGKISGNMWEILRDLCDHKKCGVNYQTVHVASIRCEYLHLTF
jgi:hypothetical protein